MQMMWLYLRLSAYPLAYFYDIILNIASIKFFDILQEKCAITLIESLGIKN